MAAVRVLRVAEVLQAGVDVGRVVSCVVTRAVDVLDHHRQLVVLERVSDRLLELRRRVQVQVYKSMMWSQRIAKMASMSFAQHNPTGTVSITTTQILASRVEGVSRATGRAAHQHTSCVLPTGLRATTVLPSTPSLTRLVMCASVIFPQFVLTPSSCRRVFDGRYLAHNGRSGVVRAMRERRWPRAQSRRASCGRERANHPLPGRRWCAWRERGWRCGPYVGL